MIALLSRGWLVFLAAIVGNAVVQAATVIPFATPAGSPAFVGLALVSGVAFVAALSVVLAQVRASALGGSSPRPRWTEWAASVAVVLALSLAGLAWSWLVPLAVTAALIVLAGVATDHGGAGFRAFRRAPVRAVMLTVVTLFVVGLLWLGALMLGFFVTGWPASGLTWLAFGAVGVVLLCAWASLASRPPQATHAVLDPASGL